MGFSLLRRRRMPNGEKTLKKLEDTRIVNGVYYFRLRIPLDIRQHFIRACRS